MHRSLPIIEFIQAAEEADRLAAASRASSACQTVAGPQSTDHDNRTDFTRPGIVPATAHAASSSTEGAEVLKFLKEDVHFQNRPAQRKVGDYRYLMRPIQEMLSPKAGRGLAVCACGHARSKSISVHLVGKPDGGHKASVGGIYRCGNGEVCPMCARSVAALRAKSYRRIHEAVTAKGGKMVTFVFTIEHEPKDELAVLLRALKTASTRARAGRIWNDKIKPLMQAVGALVDVHVRFSRRGGWHPHLHVTLACLTDDAEALKAGATMLLDRYVEALAKLGHSASKTKQSSTILDDRLNAYPAHHHRRADVSGKLSDEVEDDTSLSAFDLAELASEGDGEMRDRFIEFSVAMKGSKSGVVTASLSRALELQPDPDTRPVLSETSWLGTLPSPVWKGLLDRNLASTFLERVENFGRSGWARTRWWAYQQTNLVPTISDRIAAEITVVLRAIGLVRDAEARSIGQAHLAALMQRWSAVHGPALVASSHEYAEAYLVTVSEDDDAARGLADDLEHWASKAAIRRKYRLFHKTLPMGDGPPAPETVSHRSVSDYLGHFAPSSRHV